jgi:SpoVK/Ycf46/Vps4 family AAA+-type ATPase
VGCGKTALASCVATPVARAIDEHIVRLETPSDLRGGGHVGELSARITEAFTQAKARAAAIGRGILVIDEADDLATGRSQMQAHHEDRAGVNVLIKQINQLPASAAPIALIMITNRADVFDPAVIRRAALRLTFERPNQKARFAVFQRILQGTNATDAQIHELAQLTEHNIPYTYSDLTDRIARLALRRAWKSNQPFGVAALKAAIAEGDGQRAGARWRNAASSCLPKPRTTIPSW